MAMEKPEETVYQAPAGGLPSDSAQQRALIAAMALLAEMRRAATSALATKMALVFGLQMTRWVVVRARNFRKLEQSPAPVRPSNGG